MEAIKRDQLQASIAVQKRVVRRRELFARAFSDDVIAALAEWMGVEDAIFAFVPGKDGKLDPLEACRIDTLMGVLRGIRCEIAMKDEGERALAEMLKLEKEAQA